MQNVNSIPAGFRILAETPVLQIKFRSQANKCLIVFLLPFIALFLCYTWLLILMLYEILHLNLWQEYQKLPNLIGSYWLLLFGFLLLSVFSSFALWHIFGITYFQASHNSLIIVKQLFTMRLRISIPSPAIQYFNQMKDGGEGMDSFLSWGLEIITNQRIYERSISLPSWFPGLSDREMYRTVMLLDKQSIDKSDWLGRVLADFYDVNYRGLTTSAHRTQGSLW